MEFITWNENYSVGHDEIDLQHQGFIKRLNDLHSAIFSNDTSAMIGQVLSSLEEYADNHFNEEETVMRSLGYPEYVKHRLKHDDFRRKVGGFRKTGTEPRELLFFLQHWFIHHIKTTDLQLGKFLREKNDEKET